MSTRERIQAQLDTLTDEELESVYVLIKQFIEAQREPKPKSLMGALRDIQFDGPPDFSENFDLYTSGEKRIR